MRSATDANIVVRAIASPSGPAGAVVDQMTVPPHVLVLSSFILDEVRRVLDYPRLRKLVPLTDDEIYEYVVLVRALAEVVEPETVPAICRDPMDDAVIATAVVGMADVLCTFDKDLHDPLVKAYLATFGIRVLTDAELLRELRPITPKPSDATTDEI